MKRQKRDMYARAYKRGYLAGVSGKSKESCPLEQAEVRSEIIELVGDALE